MQRELVLVKVKADGKTRSEVMQICEIFRTKIVNVDHNEVIVELVGDSAKCDRISRSPFSVWYSRARPHGHARPQALSRFSPAQDNPVSNP